MAGLRSRRTTLRCSRRWTLHSVRSSPSCATRMGMATRVIASPRTRSCSSPRTTAVFPTTRARPAARSASGTASGHVVDQDYARDWHNRPLRSGKGSAYEGGFRVPMIVAWAGQEPGREPVQASIPIEPGTTLTEPVHMDDFFPTVLEITGAENPVPEKRERWPEPVATSRWPFVRAKEASVLALPASVVPRRRRRPGHRALQRNAQGPSQAHLLLWRRSRRW